MLKSRLKDKVLKSVLLLDEHPNWKLYFQQAYDDLGVLEKATTIGLPEVLAIINRLPVKELQSKTAKISILSATLLIEEVGSPAIDAQHVDKLRPIVRDLRKGIKLALDTSFTMYDKGGHLIVAR
jgi:hypothetical protein